MLVDKMAGHPGGCAGKPAQTNKMITGVDGIIRGLLCPPCDGVLSSREGSVRGVGPERGIRSCGMSAVRI